MLNNLKKIRMVKLNYDNSKIYKITNTNIPDKIYIGATTMTLEDRLILHVNHYKRHTNGKVTYTSTVFDIIKEDGYIIELIEAFPCKTKAELNERETYHINNTTNCINKRSKLANKEINKEKIREQGRLKYKMNIEKFKEYYKNNKERIKNYYNEKKQEEYHCQSCNCTMIIQSKSKHLNSSKHMTVIKALENLVKSTTD